MHTGKGKLREIWWLIRTLLLWLSEFWKGFWLTIPPKSTVWWHSRRDRIPDIQIGTLPVSVFEQTVHCQILVYLCVGAGRGGEIRRVKKEYFSVHSKVWWEWVYTKERRARRQEEGQITKRIDQFVWETSYAEIFICKIPVAIAIGCYSFHCSSFYPFHCSSFYPLHGL